MRCDRSSPSTSSITRRVGFDPVDGRDVRVVQGGERLGFAREPGQPIGIIRERVRQDLQRDIAIELRVAGPPHLPHAAFADLGGDFVDAEAGAGGKGQDVRDYTGGSARTAITLPDDEAASARSLRLGDFRGPTQHRRAVDDDLRGTSCYRGRSNLAMVMLGCMQHPQFQDDAALRQSVPLGVRLRASQGRPRYAGRSTNRSGTVRHRAPAA